MKPASQPIYVSALWTARLATALLALGSMLCLPDLIYETDWRAIGLDNIASLLPEPPQGWLVTLFGSANVVAVVAVSVSLLWIYRTCKNLRALNTDGLRYSATAAVLSFVIPILNLLRPYQVLREIWQASSPQRDLLDRSSWKTVLIDSKLKRWYPWWIVLLTAIFLDTCRWDLAGLLPEGQQDLLAPLLHALWIPICLAYASSSLALIWLISHIQYNQDETWRQLYALMPDDPVVSASSQAQLRKDWLLGSIVGIYLIAEFTACSPYPTLDRWLSVEAAGFRILAAASEKLLGRNNDWEVQLFNRMGNIYFHKQRYTDAEDWYKHALALDTNRSKTDERITTNLANCYYWQRRYAEAEPLYKRVLELRENRLGHTNTEAWAMDNLANNYYRQQEYTQAEPLYKKVLNIIQRKYGPDSLQLTASLQNLAHNYFAQGKYAEAEPLYVQILKIKQRKFGSDSPLLSASLENLAHTYYRQHKYTQADPLYRKVLSIQEKALGSGNPQISESLIQLANNCFACRQYSKAETLYKQALALEIQAHVPEDSHLSWLLERLAWVYSSRSDYTDALPLEQKALSIRETEFRPNLVITDLLDLSNLYSGKHDYSNAQEYLKRAMTMSQRSLKNAHAQINDCVNQLAKLKAVQGKLEQADSYHERTIELRKLQTEEEHKSSELIEGQADAKMAPAQ